MVVGIGGGMIVVQERREWERNGEKGKSISTTTSGHLLLQKTYSQHL